jgi:hypothetical protein
VVDHVLGVEVIEDTLVPGALSSEELLNDCLRFCHSPSMP